MRYASSLPPLSRGFEDKRKTKRLAETRMVKVVHERVLPTLELQRQSQPEPLPGQVRQLEKRLAEPYQQERRTYCRRISRRSILIEFRSGKERRQHSQSGTGMTEHIDEEV